MRSAHHSLENISSALFFGVSCILEDMNCQVYVNLVLIGGGPLMQSSSCTVEAPELMRSTFLSLCSVAAAGCIDRYSYKQQGPVQIHK